MRRLHELNNARGQQGLAALVVVTVLFIVTSLVAAYTSRNLVFEQRTSANQYRSTQALEAAEAGIEWALAQLNSGAIAANCQPSTNPANTSFRNRYLNIDDSGNITPRVGGTGVALWPSCVTNGTGWSCDCPSDAAPSLTAPTGGEVFPAFRVRFLTVNPGAGGLPGRPGVVRIESNGCTRLGNDCLNFPSQAAEGEGRATVSVLVALASGLSSKPAAPLVVRGNLLDALAVTVSNADLESGGITIQASGTANANASGRTISSLPGAPARLSVLEGDTSLQPDRAVSALGADHSIGLFTETFNAWAPAYKDQPATIAIDCGNTGCSAADIRNKALLNPGRPLWLQGQLLLDSAVELGSASTPVLLIVDGTVDVPAMVTATAAATVNGLIYLRHRPTDLSLRNQWTDSAGVALQGALISEGHLDGTGSPTLVYDAAILNRLRLASGSFVRVPGGWKDFK